MHMYVCVLVRVRVYCVNSLHRIVRVRGFGNCNEARDDALIPTLALSKNNGQKWDKWCKGE